MGSHEPVLLAETMELLAVSPGGVWVDGTVGQGGHAAEILRQSAPDGRLLGIDRDGESLEQARGTLASFGDRVQLIQLDWRDCDRQLAGQAPSGILLDLGISSAQLDDPDRGFAFSVDGPLDMRMDRSEGTTAADLVNRLPEKELASVIFRYGEDPASRRIARAIVQARRAKPIRTTAALAAIVRRSAGRPRPGHHPATRTFQALRIRVNRELEGLGDGIASLARRLRPGGRLVVIAFHSLEDREVKQAFRSLAQEGFRILTRKPLRPTGQEVARNPRSRSACLRALERPDDRGEEAA